MYAVIFKARIDKLDTIYNETVKRMQELATSKYGCIDILSVTEGDQEITISYWDNKEQITAWKLDPEHIKAQESGRIKWYKSYSVQIVKIEREYSKSIT